MVIRAATRCLLCFLLCGALSGVREACAQWNSLLAALANNPQLSRSTSGFSSSSHAVSVRLPIGGPHAINVTGEYFRASSLPRFNPQRLRADPDWRFRSIPVTFSYTYSLPSVTRKLQPVVGVGVSTHLFAERMRNGMRGGSLPQPGFTTRYGLRAGAEATMGIRMLISRQVFVLAQSRYRYVGTMPGIPSWSRNGPFTLLDFSLGLGFEL
ncbi:MAG: hypothetical protein R2834_06065 [Rhodothermales bacterium]